jgi:hypothetical protein
MKHLFTTLGVFAFTAVFAQESQFMGYFSPVKAELVPASKDQILPKNEVIKPNFKGRELIEVDQAPHHNLDWVWQQHENTQKNASAQILWQVQGVGANVSPPDPSGATDSLFYIQGTNSNGGASIRILNKATGANVGSVFALSSKGSPAITGAGDPIILYHKPSRRWFLTEFSSSGNRLLVYVSQTSNPQGAYNRYAFTCSAFPDYPKWSFSTSSDALIVSTNEGGPPTVYAMRLSSMIAGTASPFIKVPIGYSLNGFGFQTITPVDLEGDNPAPVGMKPLFVRHRDDERHSNGSPDSNTNDWIEMWEMTINWTNNTATVAKVQDVAIAEIDSHLCGLTSFQCFQQPNTTNRLDPLREAVMFKAPMRVFDTHQAMVLALTTDVNGQDRGGIRWIELRRPTGSLGNWSLHQEGTYAPGTTNRWMPGINIDKDGNILMAYSTSSSAAGDFPSLRMTGRRACDPLGQMTIPETTIKAGLSSRTSNTRWGDYHHMDIDQFDGKTFYFTGVYMEAQNAIRTSVSAMRIDPYVTDAAVANVFATNPNGICGASAEVAVVISNQGTSAISNGALTWQIGNGTPTTVNFTSNDLGANGSVDTVLFLVTGLTAGTNNITINLTAINGSTPDENACNDLKIIVLETTGAAGFTTDIVVDVVPNCGTQNGQVSLNVTGGQAPFTYVLGETSQSSPTFNNIGSGTYNYSITDSEGCTSTGVYNFLADVVVELTPSPQNATCFGLQNGSVSLTASGGSSPYLYSANGTDFVSSNNFSNLAAGLYNFFTQDANGCQSSVAVNITQPNALTLNAIPTMISCNGGSNGSITAAAQGGTIPYTYSVDGNNFGTSSVFSNLGVGTYTVTTKDANNCSQTFQTSITQPTAIVFNAFSTASTGNDGTISMSASGGSTPYTFSINGVNYFGGSFFSGLAPGEYTCYVRDNKGCIQTITITVEETANLSDLTIELHEVILYPNPNNGIFELEVKGVKGASVECRLFNVNGIEVSQFTLSATNGQIKKTMELSPKLAAGSYFLGVYNGEKAVVKKFVKQ